MPATSGAVAAAYCDHARDALLKVTHYASGDCSPPGIDEGRMKKLQPGGSRPCPKNLGAITQLPPEKFWNCADIRLT